MLDSIRQGVSSWIIKILLGLLILSFAVWGIGDIFLGAGSNPAVATVAGKDITAAEFVRSYQRDLQELSNRAGRPLSPDEGRQFGLARQTISRLVVQTMLAETAQDYGLSISDDLIRDAVWGNETFQDVTGRFDQNRYLQTLARNGLSEEEFVTSIRRDLTRDQLRSSISVGTFAPGPLVEPIYKHRQERRVAALAVVDVAQIGNPPAPDEPALARFYEENEARYIAPEYRSATYVWIAPDALIGEIEVTQDELERTYEARLNTYFTPERRDVEQLIFETQEAALAARDRVAAGATFDAVAADSGALNQGATRLGVVEWLDLPEDIGDAVFELSVGLLSDPVESAFGYHVIRVTDISPEGTRPLEEVRADLENEIRRTRAFDGLEDLIARLEDEMAGGRTLEDAALRVKLTSMRLDAIDRAGRDRNANPVEGIPDLERFVDTVFSTDTGQISEPVESNDGGFFVVRVDSISPEAPRPLADIRDGVVEDWTRDFKMRAARQTAEEIVAAARAGRSLDDVAQEKGSRILKSQPLTRTSGRVQAEVSAEMVSQLFALNVGDYAVAEAGNGEGFVVGRLDEILEAAPETDTVVLVQLRDVLNSSIAQDILAQYQIALQQDVGVRVNEGLLETIDLSGLPAQQSGGGSRGGLGF